MPRCRLHGAADPWLIVAGHSHVATLALALLNGAGPRDLPAAVMSWGLSRIPSIPEYHDVYWDFVAETAVGKAVAVMWWGNEHNQRFLLAPTPLFRVFDDLAAEPEAGEGEWVARETVREFFSSWPPARLRPRLERLSHVARVLVVGTPPPKPDALVRANSMRRPPNLYGALGVDLATAPLTPAPVRLALWRVVQGMLRDEAMDAGLEFVPSPAAAAGPDGLLLPEYSGPDMTHANQAYGALVWDALRDAFTRPGRPHGSR